MYISGTQYDFENRLHQLPVTLSDIQMFNQEAAIYGLFNLSGICNPHAWDKEMSKKNYQINSSLTNQQITGFPSAFLTGFVVGFSGTILPYELYQRDTGMAVITIYSSNTLKYIIGQPSQSALVDAVYITGNLNLEYINFNAPTFCPNLFTLYINNNPVLLETNVYVSRVGDTCTITGNHNLTRLTIRLSGDGIDNDPLLEIFNLRIHNNPQLHYLNILDCWPTEVFDISYNNLSSVDNWFKTTYTHTFTTDSANIDVSYNQFSTSALDSMVNRLGEITLAADGVFKCTGNPGQPSDVSLAARQFLSGLNWTFIY